MRSAKSHRRGRTRRRRSAFDNAVLDVRTARRLGRLLWRPMLSELWSPRRYARRRGHR